MADTSDFVYATVYGPYQRNTDNRFYCILVDSNGQRHTVSYGRLLMEEHLGRPLLPTEDVHHKDGDVTNNNIENLEVRDHAEHCREHSIKYTAAIEATCIYCGSKFNLTPRRQSQRARDKKRNKAGPFCSRKCVGLYGTAVQRALKEESFK